MLRSPNTQASPFLRALALLALPPLGLACAPSRYTVTRAPSPPFDAVIVPGCPSEEDGSPSMCQIGRAGEAAILWRDGWTTHFIASGSDVHSPYVEAEALAQAMTLLGIPASRIYLERDALHTDENVYYSLLLARRLGWDRLAVTNYGSTAAWMCVFMVQWEHPCSAIEIDQRALEGFLPPYDAALHALRARRTPKWEGLSERAARIARAVGYGRPPSWIFYPFYGWLGPSHRPIAPEHPDPLTWEERARAIDAPSSGPFQPPPSP